ncbi:MAG: deoxyribodipyrimidine photolyase-related protein [Lentimonas sp.]|jgi:deoxyribodipyrimidine photolyase-related protein
MQLRLIMGDQLSHHISSLGGVKVGVDLIWMCEIRTEATRVKHHKKKIAFIFSAMRHFAEELRAQGHKVHYTSYDDAKNGGSFTGEIQRALDEHLIEKIIVTDPSEYPTQIEVTEWAERLNIPVEQRADDRFLSSSADFKQWALGRKQLRMEFFYREMRRRHKILMEGDTPAGGAWNYDAENRKPPKQGLMVPPTYHSQPDAITREVLDLVATEFDDHFGDLEPFHFAVTAEQAQHALSQFIEQRLTHFGDYQDAMLQGEPWMYHSHISFYLNCGLLRPMECIQAAEHAYRKGQAPLNAVEGFIRQILGWREYVRGVYWLKMPDYANENFLQAKRALPDFFWTGQTEMNCLRQCVQETQTNAYAHHIQRLMVIGNFALIAGLHPEEVNEWFWIVYADAYQWVELPNVSGMILFADGGQLGSKPYAASGAYINKMSNYCKGCRYSVTKKTGPDACPFNYLYWDFMLRHSDKLRKNPRMGMTYRTLDKMDPERVATIQTDSEKFLNSIDAEPAVFSLQAE